MDPRHEHVVVNRKVRHAFETYEWNSRHVLVYGGRHVISVLQEINLLSAVEGIWGKCFPEKVRTLPVTPPPQPLTINRHLLCCFSGIVLRNCLLLKNMRKTRFLIVSLTDRN